MNKFLDLLEKHVQWVALGLGALYLLYMLFAYVVKNPLQVEGVAQTPLGPGQIDRHILNTSAAELRQRMQGGHRIEVREPRFVDEIVRQMEFQNRPVTAFAVNPFNAQPATVELAADPQTPQIREQLVEKLPSVPPVLIEGLSTGVSSVLLPDPNWRPDWNQPGVMPAGQEVDKSWVTVMYRINTSDIAAAFRDAQIPVHLMQTTILQVELLRQEMQPDGKWGPEQVVPRLGNQRLQPMPGPTAGLQTQWAYLQWARDNQPEIVQPPFYQVVQGDPWLLVEQIRLMEEAAALQPERPFNPAEWVNAPLNELMRLTPEQRRQVAEERERQRQEQRRTAPPTGTRGRTPATPSPRRPAGPDFAPADPDRAAHARQQRRPTMPPGMRAPAPEWTEGAEFWGPDMGYYDGAMPWDQQQPGGTPQVQFNPGNYPIPLGEFDPTGVPIITGWLHDETVQAGKTYRYSVRYSIKNPIFATANVAADPKLAEVFAITSPPADWSEAVTIRQLTRFFIAGNWAPGSNTVRFEVFTWAQGGWTSRVFAASPGDQIGAPDATTDFSTGWTVVDLRNDLRNPGDTYVLVLDPAGNVVRRDFRSDQANPELQKLRTEVSRRTEPLAGGMVR